MGYLKSSLVVRRTDRRRKTHRGTRIHLAEPVLSQDRLYSFLATGKEYKINVWTRGRKDGPRRNRDSGWTVAISIWRVIDYYDVK